MGRHPRRLLLAPLGRGLLPELTRLDAGLPALAIPAKREAMRALAAALFVLAIACSGDPAGPRADGPVAADLINADRAAPDGPMPLPAGLLVLDQVTVVDADGARAGRAVLITNGAILDVRAAGQSWPADATVIDGAGRFVTPGLVDAHVHLTYAGTPSWIGDPLEANLRASLYHGVLAVMDVGAGPSIFALRQAIASGRIVGPTLRATGPFLTAVGSHPCETSPFNDCVFVVPQSAGAEAQALVDLGADALKVALADTTATPWPGPRLDPAAIGPIAQLPRPVVAHVNSSQDVLDAAAGGARILAHPVFVGTMSPAAVQAAATLDGVHTTLGAFAGAPDLVDGKLDLKDPELVVAPGVTASWQAVKDNPALLLPGWIKASRDWTAGAGASVKALRAAKANLIPGSDAGYLFVPHGLGLQRELRRLAALGFSPRELLTAATLGARKLLGLPGGKVAAGEVADLLLLDADPLKSVEALDDIHAVVLHGAYRTRQALLTLEMQPSPGKQGESCLGPGGCAAGLACDRLAHLCRPACPTPYAAQSPCGPGAWCMPLDALPATTEGVCRPEAPCDPYSVTSCGPASYTLTCQPLDADTSGCILAGAAAAGQSCGYADGGTSCRPGLYCSTLDATCYQLCDPKAAQSGCPTAQSCVLQSAGAGVDWFGLCL